MLVQSHSLIDGLARHRDELTTTLDSVATMAGQVDNAVTADRPQVDDLLHREPGFTRHFTENASSFAYLGFNMAPMFQGLARTTQEGSYLDIYPCDFHVTLVPALSTLVSTIVDAASPTGKAQQSAMCR